jgi:hypothetical protein
MSDILSYDHGDAKLDDKASSIEQLMKDNNIPTLGLGLLKMEN